VWYGYESSVKMIALDLPRTFPDEDGDSEVVTDAKHCLQAWAFYRPDIGYVQGMSNLCAVLCPVLDDQELLFQCFCNLILGSVSLTVLYSMTDDVEHLFELYTSLLWNNAPALAKALHRADVTPSLYVLDWWLTVYSRLLSTEATARFWDVWLLEDDTFLYRSAIGMVMFQTSRAKVLSEDRAKMLDVLKAPVGTEDLRDLFCLMDEVTIPPFTIAGRYDELGLSPC